MSRISARLDAKIRRDLKNRCSYCLLLQTILSSLLEIEHILPTSKGGSDDEANLCLSCRGCNGYKSDKIEGFDSETKKSVKLFNPRTQKWKRHFECAENFSKIIGKTAGGRATARVLKMNRKQTVDARIVRVAATWFPPQD